MNSSSVKDVAQLMRVIVVAGKGSTSSVSLSEQGNPVDYLTVQKQQDLYPELAAAIPENHMARKNVGYLHAIHLGACFIWDFDQESILSAETKNFLSAIKVGTRLKAELMITSAQQDFVNAYLLYGSPTFMWPRGYPQHLTKSQDFPKLELAKHAQIDVVQVMQNHHPDVDTYWRAANQGLLPMSWEVQGPIAE